MKKRRFVVAPAMAPIATHGSAHGVNGSHRRPPSSVYGYTDSITSGLATWSDRATACQPVSSAAFASGTNWSRGLKDEGEAELQVGFAHASVPPSTRSDSPLTWAASSLARKAMAAATVSGPRGAVDGHHPLDEPGVDALGEHEVAR